MNTFMDIQIYWIDIQSDGWIGDKNCVKESQNEKVV